MAALKQAGACTTARSSLLIAPSARNHPRCFQPVNSQSSQAQRARLPSRQLGAQQVMAVAQQALVGEVESSTPQLPKGYHWYETMMILKTTLSDEERDKELAKFEAFLNKEECQNISALVRGRNRLAYPLKGNWEGIFVLYNYAAKRATARTIQSLLSNPESGSEDNVLRFITFFKA